MVGSFALIELIRKGKCRIATPIEREHQATGKEWRQPLLSDQGPDR